MNRAQRICPITYELLENDQQYSIKGLRKLSPRLNQLQNFPYTAEQQIIESRKHADKMSIQGVQPKLSARLDTKKQIFELCDRGGNYILKLQNPGYEQLPENENLTMHLASSVIKVPLHGLLYCIDGNFTYFIKRFDRVAYNNKVPLEDFAQLAGLTRDTKYDFSMEKIIALIDKYCTFPVIEKTKLFTRVIFNYLIGNEDMHLKNYSLITRNEIIELAPAYDFINTTIAIGINNCKEEIALSLNGKKNNLNRKDIVEYYGTTRLGLKQETIQQVLKNFSTAIPNWYHLINISFLSDAAKKNYIYVLNNRSNVLQIF